MGSEEVIDKINQLEEEYIKVVSDIYPGLATLWGDENGKFSDITKTGIKNAIETLFSIKKKCNEINNIDYLKSNIDMRIFELTILRNKVLTAFYFYDAVYDTLLILWDDFVFYKYGLKESVLIERLTNIVPAIDIAMNEMYQREFSYLDIVFTEDSIKNVLGILKEKQKEYEHLLNLFLKVEKKSLELLSYVSRLKESVNDINKLYSYGPDIILQYIKIKSNWDIDKFTIESFYNEAIKNLSENTINNYSGDKKCNVELITRLIKEIYEDNKVFFGEIPSLLSNLKIVEFDDKKNINDTFYYVNAIEKGKVIGYLFFSSKYRYESIEQLKLKLVHEIYPGHHYMKTIILKDNHSENKHRLWINDILFEGWAKYCECFYAKMNCQNELFNSNLAFMSLMFVIVMDIHYYCLSLQEVIKHTKELSKLDSKYLKMLVINAFRDWEIHLNYFFGFNYLSKKESFAIENLIN